MTFLKHILVMAALVASMLPCNHALAHYGHGPEAGSSPNSLVAPPCECHSCDHHVCTDDVDLQYDSAPAPDTIEPPGNEIVLFSVPDPRPVANCPNPPVSATLAILQTVQLLI